MLIYGLMTVRDIYRPGGGVPGPRGYCLLLVPGGGCLVPVGSAPGPGGGVVVSQHVLQVSRPTPKGKA